MSKELVISANRHETRVAVLEEDQLVEVYFQRANEYSLAGSIHKGRVTRVLPGMQSAFVDLGLERDTFLYVSDFFEENEEYDRLSTDRPPAKDDRPRDITRRDARPERPPRQQEPFGPRLVPPAEQPPEAVIEPAPVSIAAGIPPPPDATESQENRDARGRRSRRRRSRGRGFPDSKYASATGTDEAVAEPAEPEAEAEPVEVFLLPGESLAKYTRSGFGPPELAEEQEVFEEESQPATGEIADEQPAPQDHENGVFPRTSAGHEVTEHAVAEGAPVTEHPKVHAEKIQAEVSHADDKESQEEPALPVQVKLLPNTGESVHEFITSHGAAPARSPSEAVSAQDAEAVEEALSEEQGLQPREEELENESAHPSQDAGSATGAAFESALASTFDEEGGLSPIDTSEGPDDALAETADASSDGPPPEGGTPSAPGENLTATVREQGGRFMRGSRGVRRRRGRGDRGDRPQQETRGEGTPSVPGVTSAATSGATPAAAPPEEPHRSARAERPERGERPPLPSIAELLKEGQEIIVQIAKEPLGQKGARITSHIALPGRYVVYMPSLDHLGVSRKIESDEERLRLKRILQASHAGLSGGYIVRTAGEGKSEEEIAADMTFLYNLWLDIRQKAEKKPAPLLLHHDLEIVQRILRDQFTDNFKTIWTDNEDIYESVLRFVQRFQPAMVSRVKMYTREVPIFDAFNITQELEKALRPKVWLKSGGYIVINQTEALVAIDINTGKYVGKSNRLEDTIVKTNTEAVKEIVRQIRLRDLGGIIVVDFIDMDERKNRQKVMQALEEAMRADRAPNKILQFNDFGLVAITRKRVKQSLERTLCSPCPTCEGAGYVKSTQTVINEILQEAAKLRKAVEGSSVVLRVNPEVAKVLKSSSNKYLEEVEEILGRTVLVTGDPTLHPEKFDLA